MGEALAADLGLDTEMLDTSATNVVREIISKLPLELLDNMGAETSLANSSGVAVTTNRILGVTRTDADGILRPARKVSHLLEHRVEDTSDLLYASDTSPIWFPKNGKIYVKPDPTSSQGAKISAVSSPAVDASSVEIVGFPDELEPLVVMGMLIWVKFREMGLARRNSQTELEAITSSGYLAAFEGDLPVFAPPTEPSMPTLTLPTVPSSVLAYTSAGDEPEDTISVTTPLPAYSGPTAFTYDTSHTADALTQAQDMMDNSGLGTTDVEALIDTSKHLDQARVGIQAIGVELQRAQASIQDERAQLQDVVEKIREALGKFSGETAVFQAELAKEVAEAGADVQAYVAKMQDNRNILDKDITQYREDLNKYRNQATAVINEYGQKASAEVAEYQALVQERAGEFQANLSKAMARLQESNIRLQTMQNFDQKSIAALNEARVLQAEFDKKLNGYIAGVRGDSQVIYADRRRS